MNKKEYILREVQNVQAYQQHPIENLEECVDLFFVTLDYKIPDKDFGGVGDIVNPLINKIASGQFLPEDLVSMMRALGAATETYAKKVLYIVNPDTLFNIMSEKKGYTPALSALGFKNAYKMADKRNTVAVHKAPTLSMPAIHTHIANYLLDYIRITEIKSKELKEIICTDTENKHAEDIINYINNIIRLYRNKEEEGFKYFDVHWVGEKSDSVDYNIAALVSHMKTNDYEFSTVKILGEAGTGKTTALKRIEYELAKQYKNDNKDSLPVYLGLGELDDVNAPIQAKIEDKLQMDTGTIREMLKSGKVTLLLDGYNEILAQPVKRAVAKEIDGIFRQHYSSTKIYLTDRTISKNTIPILRDAEKLFLKELSAEDKLSYLRARVDEENYKLIEKKMNDHPAYFNSINTPLKLEHFSELVIEKGEIPEDLTDSWIRRIIEREFDENKEIEMRDIEYLLQALAIYMYDNVDNSTVADGESSLGGFPEVNVVGKLVELKNKLGFEINISRLLEVAIGMDLLYNEDGIIRFSNREYLTYFMLEGYDNGLDQDFIQK